MSAPALPTRVDKFVRDLTGWSRRAIVAAIEAGRIRVQSPNGGDLAAQWQDVLVFPDDCVTIDGQTWPDVPTSETWVFHKPAGVVTTLSDPSGRPCISDFLRDFDSRLFPIGRLDAETTGLLLLSNDGDLAHLLLHPRHHAEKEYHLVVSGDVDTNDPRLTALQEGVMLDDGPARALRTFVLERFSELTRLGVVVAEGRNRMVRRMARRVGLDLRLLHRHRLGDLVLGDLEAGVMRPLTASEMASLWAPFGGRDAVVRMQISALRKRAERLSSEGRPNARLDQWLDQQRF
jgi:23S rRNA pseudouridine2605 synthase